MKWSYLIWNLTVTLFWSPILFWVLKLLWNFTGSTLSFEGGRSEIIGTLFVVFFVKLFFFIGFYSAIIFYSITPVLVYILVFCVLKKLELSIILSKGLLIITLLSCILITFYSVNGSTIFDDFLTLVFCGVGILSGIFFKLKNEITISKTKLGF